ncbi:MAG: Zn-dependent hydrolase [Hyphomicrobiaceae bacterium]
MVNIDPARVLGDLNALRQFGTYKTGVHRPTLSDADMAARHWLADQLRALDYEVTIDGIANVVGLSGAKGPRLLAGSHIESQNHAGWLDGPLGVIYALEAARAVKASPELAGAAVDVIGFCDEEGHFGNFLGSRSLMGELPEAEIDTLADRTHGEPLRDALKRSGLAGRPRLSVDPKDYVGFLESHIEQGDWLEANQLEIGIVTSVVGVWQYLVVFDGVQNHAGTTRMAIRKDAGVALAKLAVEIDRRFPEVAGPRSVWTTGRITLDPGQRSIIPGHAELLFQFRDADPERLLLLERTLKEIAAEADAKGPCRVRVETLRQSVPAVMAPTFQDALEAAAEHHAPGKHTRMPSGAGHDAQVMAMHMPSGMLFVPSIGGISHHWSENTSDADIVRGARVYADAAASLLKRAKV